jgi:PPK2 family polyphosphate:nucleotide phosphotransferase
MSLSALLLAACLCAPARAGGSRVVTVPSGMIPGVSLPGSAASIPSLPSIPQLPVSLAAPGVQTGVSISQAGDFRLKAEMSGPKAEGTQRSGAAAPTAKAALTNLSSSLAGGGSENGGGGKKGSGDAPLKAAFDGAFEKGTIEADVVAPAPNAQGRVDLSKLDPSDTHGMKRKKAEKKLAKDQVKLDELQQVLYADHHRKVLIVLQAMDTGGKDGTIRHVMRSLNPQGVQVASFKKPTEQEAKHHFLWRIKKALGGLGMITIFNRSHYEDLLAPTVYKTFSPEEIEKRYDTINKFEKKLSDEGWTILKFFLYISKDEQKARLQARLDTPDKNWKFSPEDLKSRALWPKFQAVYEQILGRTNTPWAPWFIVPANNKWYRDFVVGRIIKRALKRLDLQYPAPAPNLPKTIPD